MTISFNRLGNDGRLGNQMFQYAFLRGVAKNRKFDWMIPGDDEYSRHNYVRFSKISKDVFLLAQCYVILIFDIDIR